MVGYYPKIHYTRWIFLKCLKRIFCNFSISYLKIESSIIIIATYSSYHINFIILIITLILLFLLVFSFTIAIYNYTQLQWAFTKSIVRNLSYETTIGTENIETCTFLKILFMITLCERLVFVLCPFVAILRYQHEHLLRVTKKHFSRDWNNAGNTFRNNTRFCSFCVDFSAKEVNE